MDIQWPTELLGVAYNLIPETSHLQLEKLRPKNIRPSFYYHHAPALAHPPNTPQPCTYFIHMESKCCAWSGFQTLQIFIPSKRTLGVVTLINSSTFIFKVFSLKSEPLYIADGNVKWYSHCGKQFSYCSQSSRVWHFVTPWTIAHQAPLSMEFSRQEYWSRVPFPPSGDLPYPEIKPVSLRSPALAGIFFCYEHHLWSP